MNSRKISDIKYRTFTKLVYNLLVSNVIQMLFFFAAKRKADYKLLLNQLKTDERDDESKYQLEALNEKRFIATINKRIY